MGDEIVVAAYRCGRCDVEGTDPEAGWYLVYCWSCGRPARVTARIKAVPARQEAA